MTERELFSKRLRYYMSIRDVAIKDLAEAINIPYRTVYDWYKGNKYPRPEKIELIADYLNITKYCLLFDDEMEAYNFAMREARNEQLEKVIKTVSGLDKDKLDVLEMYLKVLSNM